MATQPKEEEDTKASVANETPMSVEEKIETEPIKIRKKVKAKKQQHLFMPKAEEIQVSKAPKNNPNLPQIIATNHLLNRKLKRRKSDEPAPVPKDPVVKQEEEDFFIDSYKMNNELFSGSGALGSLIDFHHEDQYSD